MSGTARFFKKVSTLIWSEELDGTQVHEFDFVYQEFDNVILYSTDRNFYLKLSSTCAIVRKYLDFSNNDIPQKEIYKGAWLQKGN